MKGERERYHENEERPLRSSYGPNDSSTNNELHPRVTETVAAMIIALKQMIDDAQTAEETRYEAFNGELLSAETGRYTSQFIIKISWEVQENSRLIIELNRARRERIDATIVSLVATTLLLTTKEPLPTHVLPHITLLEDMVWLLERQQEALMYLHETSAQFGAKVLGYLPTKEGHGRTRKKIGAFVPNERQQQALSHSLGSEKTFIIGPGGTGKSAVSAMIVNYLLRQGLSVLIVSHTNIATDNIFLRQVQAIGESKEKSLQ